MKLSRKSMIVGLSIASAITLGVGSTATYAWFRTVRTASLSLSDVTLKTRTSDLLLTTTDMMSGNVTGHGTTTDADRNIDLTVAADYNVTDISGDGRSFYHPEFDPHHDKHGDLQASSINEVKNGTKDTNTGFSYFYIQVGLTLKNTGKEAIHAYIDGGSAITAKTSSDEDKNVAGATRVSLYSVSSGAFGSVFTTGSNGTLVTMWGNTEPDTTTYPYQYLGTGAGTTAYGYSGVNLIDVPAATWHAGEFNNTLKSAPADPEPGADLGQIAAESSIYLVMSIWVEGTTSYATGILDDSTATDFIKANGGKSSVALNFVGFPVAEA